MNASSVEPFALTRSVTPSSASDASPSAGKLAQRLAFRVRRRETMRSRVSPAADCTLVTLSRSNDLHHLKQRNAPPRLDQLFTRRFTDSRQLKGALSIHDALTNPPETDDPAMIHNSTSHLCLDRSTERIPRYSPSIRRRRSCLARHSRFTGRCNESQGCQLPLFISF